MGGDNDMVSNDTSRLELVPAQTFVETEPL